MPFRISSLFSRRSQSIQDLAAQWSLRIERGLNDEEELELMHLKVQRPGFERELEKYLSTGKVVSRLPDSVFEEMLNELETQPRVSRRAIQWSAMAAAAIFGIGMVAYVIQTQFINDDPIAVAVNGPTTQILPDDSLVRLNSGARYEVMFDSEIRKINWIQGEGHFRVKKSSERPFVVTYQGVDVIAVGTAFNVKVEDARLDVLVTEGIIAIGGGQKDTSSSVDALADAYESVSSHQKPDNFLVQGQRAEISFDRAYESPVFTIIAVPEVQIQEELSWQASLMTLEGNTIQEIASTFHHKTGCKLVVVDSDLNDVRIGGQFPSDDVEGFLRALELGYGIPWSRLPDGTVLLGKL